MHVVQALVALNVGGSELVATELAEFLALNGHQVTVIAKDGPIGDRVRASGATHLGWAIGRKHPATLRYIWKLRDWFCEVQPDIVHVHSRWPAWICWQALKRTPANRRPLFITTMHGHYTVSGYSAVMAKGSKVIAVSEHIRNYTLQNYPDESPDKVVTIHGGVSREDFPYDYAPSSSWRDSVEAEFPALAGKRWLMLPGRVTRWKGHHDFIRLLSLIAGDYPDVQGVFVGGCRKGSSYERELRKAAEKHGLASRLTITGNRLDIRDWMGAADIAYNLSNDPPEAFGRTVLEALSLGTVLIGWDQGGAAEIMTEMFPEARVPVKDMAALEQRTRDFLDNPRIVPRSEAFTLENSMKKHLGVYEALCAQRNSMQAMKP